MRSPNLGGCAVRTQSHHFAQAVGSKEMPGERVNRYPIATRAVRNNAPIASLAVILQALPNSLTGRRASRSIRSPAACNAVNAISAVIVATSGKKIRRKLFIAALLFQSALLSWGLVAVTREA